MSDEVTPEERAALEALRYWGRSLKSFDDAEERRLKALGRQQEEYAAGQRDVLSDPKTMSEARVSSFAEAMARSQVPILERHARLLWSLR